MPIEQIKLKKKKRKSPRNVERFAAAQKAPKREERKPKKAKETKGVRKNKLIGLLIKLGTIGFLAFIILAIGAYGYFSRGLPNVNDLFTRSVAESTKIYDRTGENLLYDIHGEQKRTSVSLENINPEILWATISAEDKHFYEHGGVNFIALFKGVILDPLRGRRARGGSTLTQQLVKNAILTPERTYTRKIKELILARRLESKKTKDEIITMYFNEIPYGSVVYGIEAAAQYYFGTTAKEVSVAEAAILAALPKGPTKYSPYGSNKDELIWRQQWILDEMVSEEYITKEQAEEAKAFELVFEDHGIEETGIVAPHFVMYVREYLSEKYGEKITQQGGLVVKTTLDVDKQKIAEEVIANNVEAINGYGASNAALVSIDAKNGEILAMVGSVDFFNEEIDGQVNVTIRDRQPGSSIKPMAYATAFEKGYTPETILYDAKTTFPTETGPYAPLNYDLKERGPVTIRTALHFSLNIPAVKALYLAGVETVKGKLVELGYSTISTDSPCGLSIVLGGCEVKLLDHVGAYSTFARDGERTSISAILEIKDKTGDVLEEYKPEQTRVFSKATARSMNNVLSGTSQGSSIGSHPAAAKTGTTNNFKDAWTVGYTPSIVTGVWVGNNDATEMYRGAAGAVLAAPIWRAYMQQTLAGTPVEYFKPGPKTDDGLKPVLRGVSTPEYEVEVDKASGKLATALTPETYKEIKKYKEVHSILYYVNKEDPLGDPPQDPASDQMFAPWESGIIAWTVKKVEEDIAKALEEGVEDFVSEWAFVNEAPPTEFDDLHTEENRPILTVLAPTYNQLIDINPVSFSVQTSAPRGINRVEYKIEETIIGMIYIAPYNLTSEIVDFGSGYYQLHVTAYDDIDNAKTQTVELNLNLPQVPINVSFLNPRDNSTFYQNNFPLTFDLSLNRTTDIKVFQLFFENETSEFLIAELKSLPGKSLSIKWQSPPPKGTYRVFARTYEKDGTGTNSTPITLEILP